MGASALAPVLLAPLIMFSTFIMLPTLVTLPLLRVEDGAFAEPVSVTLALGPLADCPGVGAGVEALPEGPGLDTDGAGPEAVVPPPVVGAKGTTGRLPGVVPGDDGGTGTSLCMCTNAAYIAEDCIEAEQPLWSRQSNEGASLLGHLLVWYNECSAAC